jgi:hypothetical protein
MKLSKKQKLAAYVGSGLAVSAGSAFAEVPAAVTTAITGAGTDVATIGGAVLVVIITIATFMWLRRPMH